MNINNENSIPLSGVEYKTFQFRLIESKEVKGVDGDTYGYISGYASVFGNVDKYGDIVKRGAFSSSIKEHRERNRPIKLFFNHRVLDAPIGGVDPSSLTEDEHGLFCTAKINKKTSLGNDCYELAKQGVLCEFSFGYRIKDFAIENNNRILKDLIIGEISLVGAPPANDEAVVTEVKAFNSSNIEDFKKNSDLIKRLNDIFKLDQSNLKEALFKRYIEDVLTKSGDFTKQAAVYLASHYAEWGDSTQVIQKQGDPEDNSQKITSELMEAVKILSALKK